MNTAINVLKEENQQTYDWLKPIGTLLNAGLYLVPIPPDKKTGKPLKGPIAVGWNHSKAKNNPKGYSNDIADFAGCKGFNFGLAHLPAKTAALDLDSLSDCLALFDDLGLPLREWLDDPNRVEIQSGKANRGKLLYRLPDGVDSFATQQLKANGVMVFELRNSSNKGTTVQDVIHGTHPDARTQYKVIGDINNIPEIPEALLDIALHWDDWKPCFESALGIDQETPKIAHRAQQQGDNLAGKRSPIHEFNQANTPTSILISNGYKPVGKNRFIRPGSSSKAPGIVILADCKDSADRVYSFGGDVLNDGFGHDAFDCRRYFELGDTNPHIPSPKALGWSEEITEHNQALWKQSNNATQPSARHDNVVSLSSTPLQHENINTVTSVITPQDYLSEWEDGDFMADNAKAPEYLINDILETDSHGILGGASMAFKTFADLRMVYSICTGNDFFGHEVFTTGKVLYVCGEGRGALSRRIRALKLTESDFNGNLQVLKRPLRIDNQIDMQWLRQSIDAINPVAVVFDTFASLVSVTDENSPSDVGRALRLIKETCRNGKTCSLIIHHYGKDATKGLRGASNFTNDVDFAFEMVRDADSMATTMSCKKMKDGESFEDIPMMAHVVELGIMRQDGEMSTSLVLKPVAHQTNKKFINKRKKLTGNNDVIFSALLRVLETKGVPPTHDITSRFGGFDSGKRIVKVSEWKEEAFRSLGQSRPESTNRSAFDRAQKALQNVFAQTFDDYWWVI